MRYEIINSGPDSLLRFHCACGHAIEAPVWSIDAGDIFYCLRCHGYFRLPGERITDADYQGADE